MRNYKLSELQKIDSAYRTAGDALKTAAIEDVARTFAGNVDRIVSTATFPAGLLDFRREFWVIWQHAQKSLIDTHDPKYPSTGHQWDDLKSQMPAICKRLISEGELRPQLPGMLKPFTREWIKNESEMIESAGFLHPGWLMLEAMVACSEDFLAHGVDATLSSLVVGMWTAFETLAGDLWVAAVNAQPSCLAGLTGTANRVERRMGSNSKQEARVSPTMAEGGSADSGEADDEDRPPESGKLISLSEMHKATGGGYDLSKKMGDLLVASGRVNFVRLEPIREAYSLAFSERVKRARTTGIDAALGDRALDALSALRNLIVHKAGAVDATYVEDCKRAPAAPQLKPPAKLQLDGQICRELIEPVAGASLSLIKAVDSWLTLTRR